MSLTVSERKNKKHFYFKVDGEKKLYLGEEHNPKEKMVKIAMGQLNSKIRKYEREFHKLGALLPRGDQDSQLKYKLVVFDLDGVLYEKPWDEMFDVRNKRVAVSTWDILFRELQIYPVHEKLKREFEEGVFSNYMEWTNAACEALKGIRLRREAFEGIINERPPMVGAEDTLQRLVRGGARIAVVTGSFKALADRLQDFVSIDEEDIYAHCELVFDRAGLLKRWKLNPTDYKDKAKWVREIAHRYNIPREQRAYVGDDVDDIEAFKEVGLAIAFNTRKPEIREAADLVIESRDLRTVLSHLFEHEGVEVVQ